MPSLSQEKPFLLQRTAKRSPAAVVGAAVLVAVPLLWRGLGGVFGLLCALALAIGGAILLARTLWYRLVIDADGIRHRGFGPESFTPWSEVTGITDPGPSGAVTVTRRGKPPLVLKLPPVPALGEPDPDELLTTMRELAGLPVPARPAPAGEKAAAKPYAGRPSRSALCWVIPVLLLSAAVMVFFFTSYSRISALGAVSVAYHTRLLLLLLLGRTEAGRAGLRNRTVFRDRRVPWSRVRHLEVVPTPFGRLVVAVSEESGRIALAAPREGLAARNGRLDADLAALIATAGRKVPVHPLPSRLRLLYVAISVACVLIPVTAEKPWLDPWWPSRHEATALPDACMATDQTAVRRLVPGSTPDHSSSMGSGVDRCRWSRPSAPFRGAELHYRLVSRIGDDGATERAIEEMRKYRGDGATSIPGLGDEALTKSAPLPSGINHVELWARRANVIVYVKYTGRSSVPVAETEMENLARHALDHIRLE